MKRSSLLKILSILPFGIGALVTNKASAGELRKLEPRFIATSPGWYLKKDWFLLDKVWIEAGKNYRIKTEEGEARVFIGQSLLAHAYSDGNTIATAGFTAPYSTREHMLYDDVKVIDDYSRYQVDIYVKGSPRGNIYGVQLIDESTKPRMNLVVGDGYNNWNPNNGLKGISH